MDNTASMDQSNLKVCVVNEGHGLAVCPDLPNVSRLIWFISRDGIDWQPHSFRFKAFDTCTACTAMSTRLQLSGKTRLKHYRNSVCVGFFLGDY